MKSIQVVTDVKLDPNSPTLILVRDTFEIRDGEFVSTGVTEERKADIFNPRASVRTSLRITGNAGLHVAASVANSGLVPFPLSKVALACTLTKAPNPEFGPTLMSFNLTPGKRWESQMIFPGESREYVLLTEFAANAMSMINKHEAADPEIVAYSDKNPVGRERVGEIVGAWNEVMREQPERVVFSQLAQASLESLTKAQQDRVVQRVELLASIPFSDWGNRKDVRITPRGNFVIEFQDNIKVIVGRNGQQIEVIDVVNFDAKSESSGASAGPDQ